MVLFHPKTNPSLTLDSFDVDVEMCKHFGVEVDDRNYHAEWYDGVEGPLTDGRTLAEMREVCVKEQDMCMKEGEQATYQHLIDILDWLESMYTMEVVD